MLEENLAFAVDVCCRPNWQDEADSGPMQAAPGSRGH
jgi:hypothetical protein